MLPFHKGATMHTKRKGDLAEKKALNYLKKIGYSIIEQNYYAKKLGEIDIIATKNDAYHFIEVKSGSTFDPRQNLSSSKMSKLINSVHLYVKHHRIRKAFCIDACIIEGDKIEMIENITL